MWILFCFRQTKLRFTFGRDPCTQCVHDVLFGINSVYIGIMRL